MKTKQPKGTITLETNFEFTPEMEKWMKRMLLNELVTQAMLLENAVERGDEESRETHEVQLELSAEVYLALENKFDKRQRKSKSVYYPEIGKFARKVERRKKKESQNGTEESI